MLFPFSIAARLNPQPDYFARDVYLGRCAFAKAAEEIAGMNFPDDAEIYIPTNPGFVSWLLGGYPRLFVDTANGNQIMWAPTKAYVQPWAKLSDHAIHNVCASLPELLDLARQSNQ